MLAANSASKRSSSARVGTEPRPRGLSAGLMAEGAAAAVAPRLVGFAAVLAGVFPGMDVEVFGVTPAW